VPFEIGADCLIRKAILDKDVVVGDGSVIENAAGVAEADHELYSVHSGIVVVPKGAVLPPGTRI
jgi:glucose-1-phosphate adenylyltransferase